MIKLGQNDILCRGSMVKKIMVLGYLLAMAVTTSKMVAVQVQTLDELVAFYNPELQPVCKYPKICEWIRQCHTKYPTVGFDQIPMYVTKELLDFAHISYPNGARFICVPEQLMHKQNEQDEFSILHEIGHYYNHKYAIFNIKGQIACVVGSLLASFMLAHKIISLNKNQTIPTKIGVTIGGGLLAMIMIKTLNAIILRIDETKADQFACKNANEQALIFAYLFMDVAAEYRKNDYATFLHRWLVDFGHPADKDRALQIAKTYEKRFNKKLDLEELLGIPLLTAKRLLIKTKFLLKDCSML